MALRLIPEVLDIVDIVSLFDESLRVVDPFMAELRSFDNIVAG